ncbi:S-layer homology domain-containing protein [Filifactor villosus]|uniref:S-layer homology domain-containing protein n=1 Tax=Filifactor villosus TaxID=29374 RepID=A0ABV9QJ93_9FIRM
MKQWFRWKRAVSAVLATVLVLTGFSMSFADSQAVDAAIRRTAVYMTSTNKSPELGTVGGDWTVLGLSRSSSSVPAGYYDVYYRSVAKEIKEKKGVLHPKKYTEYSRLILALTALGRDPSDVEGYDLLEKMSDYDKVVWQGLNGPIWALIAVDSHKYEIPKVAKGGRQNTRELLIQEILNNQLDDGGFAFGAKSAKDQGDPDMTGMAIQALAPYRDKTKVKKALDRAVAFLSTIQNEDGGYSTWGAKTSESAAQVLVALTAMGVDPEKDKRFIKNSYSVVDNLLSYQLPSGGFMHVKAGDKNNGGGEAGKEDGMATDQALYALTSYSRLLKGKTRLYDMTDVKFKKAKVEKKQPVSETPSKKAEGGGFTDVSGHRFKAEIIYLAQKGIVSGTTPTTYEPGKRMTRAEFATILVKALSLKNGGKMKFRDVSRTSWYYDEVSAASNAGLIRGSTAEKFLPNDPITVQEAAVILANAAKYKGFDISMNEGAARDMLAQFEDYTTSDKWARPYLAYCLKAGILFQDEMKLRPKSVVSRGEMAKMVYQLIHMEK